ncbi:MAG: 30S ribosomal protein S2 [candidate division WWE3 bacterium GW2011_GWA1_46_21]|uniref:Small ribosomal subunit protein uS2 n=2 Tax=Katanobacteria TaxID=422282 RepID=A0A0G1PBA7_UNCKA|nr:MAG: 30S ribosomal protein S2 [candidate division WWE3 bacterium GW2011_GWA1_46_21]KKU49653.1 MAG: 30S ribosomal protein S2 [candidate division WWE3 bacterium GW2011_GWC1_47_10]
MVSCQSESCSIPGKAHAQSLKIHQSKREAQNLRTEVFFVSMTKYKIPKPKELLEAGVHFGHQVRRWNPGMEPYIYTQMKGIHIIDLQRTQECLKIACEFLHETAKQKGQIVFVGTKRQAADIVAGQAKRCGAFFVSERWLGGTITNFPVIKKNIDKLVEFKRKMDAGEFNHYTKKERLLIEREILKLEKSVGGIVGLKGVPAALFVVDVRKEKTAVREAKRRKVPVAALVDTNSSPLDVAFVIPGNDDAIKSISALVGVVADAVESGYNESEKEAVLDAKS